MLNLSQASPRLVQPAPSVVLFVLARYIISPIYYEDYSFIRCWVMVHIMVIMAMLTRPKFDFKTMVLQNLLTKDQTSVIDDFLS